MCGRYFFDDDGNAIAQVFTVRTPKDPLKPRYNIAPTQLAPVIRCVRDVNKNEERELAMLRWGLVPHWAKDVKIGSSMINARDINSDGRSIDKSPAFGHPFKKQRCLVPASGFFEWQPMEPGRKQPHAIKLFNEPLFAMAGLYTYWHGKVKDEDADLQTYTIITCEPNELLAPFHNRMPVILPRAHWSAWLDPDNQDVEALKKLLLPYPAEEMTVFAVETAVGNVKSDDASLIQAKKTTKALEK